MKARSPAFTARKSAPDPAILVVDGNDRFRFLTNNPQSTNHSFAAMTGQNISDPHSTLFTMAQSAMAQSNSRTTQRQCGFAAPNRRKTAHSIPHCNRSSPHSSTKAVTCSFPALKSAWDLDRASGPTTADRNFYHNQLRAVLNNDDAATHAFTPLVSSIFTGDTAGNFDNGVGGYTYDVAFPDVLTPTNGSIAAINYTGGLGGAAAIVYDGTPSSGKVVNWGFPFETVTNSALRDMYMSDVLRFFNLLPSPTLFPATVSGNTSHSHGPARRASNIASIHHGLEFRQLDHALSRYHRDDNDHFQNRHHRCRPALLPRPVSQLM